MAIPVIAAAGKAAFAKTVPTKQQATAASAGSQAKADFINQDLGGHVVGHQSPAAAALKGALAGASKKGKTALAGASAKQLNNARKQAADHLEGTVSTGTRI